MRNQQNYLWRLYIVLALLILGMLGLIWRFIDLNFIQRQFLVNQSKARILRKMTIYAHRGMIVDRLGKPLAISTPVDSVWVNPKIFAATETQLKALSLDLKIPLATLKQRVSHQNKHRFVYLKRKIPPALGAAVKSLDIQGLFLQHEYERYYPEGEMTAHVVGLTNIDDRGQEGLELAYDKWLKGKNGLQEAIKDRMGHDIANVALLKKPEQGGKLTLSIDHRIQYLADRALMAAIKKFHAKSGSVVVLDVNTGEILAMVNRPTYNPNNRPSDHDGRYRNRAVTDSYEPGSVIKPFNIVLALESGKYTPNSIIDTRPGWMKVGGYRIKDDLNYGVVSLTQVLEKSSNIGAAKIMLSLQPQAYWNLLRRFGFGQRTQSGFPGESAGILVPRSVWYPSQVATLAYGYGIAVTALQLAHGYAILANHGVSVPVTFLKRTKIPQGQQVISAKIARQVVKMMETVVSRGGTGTLAKVPGYQVAGKTGTAYIAGPNGYNRHKYMASFVGMAPAADPKLVVVVAIREPKTEHFGGLVSAPVFSKVMGGALRILDIPPISAPSAIS